MKLANVLIVLFLITLSSCEPEQENLIVIPKPESVVMLGGNLKLSKNFTISIQDNKLSSVVEIFGQQVKQQVTPSVETGNAAVEISLIQNKDLGNEGYQVNVTRKKIFIKAQEAHGIFNALQTLRQMILFGEQKNGEILLPCCQIKDTPRFSWRGIMVDESRHFFGQGTPCPPAPARQERRRQPAAARRWRSVCAKPTPHPHGGNEDGRPIARPAPFRPLASRGPSGCSSDSVQDRDRF
jgi:hypothetical protein